MRRYRIEVGRDHGVEPGNIVGAISNEAALDGRFVGQIRILDDFSLVDLPEGMPGETLRHLKTVRVCGRALRIRLAEAAPRAGEAGRRPADRAGKPAGKAGRRPGGSPGKAPKPFKKKQRHKKRRVKKNRAQRRAAKPSRES